MANVIINDYVANKRVKLFFLPDDFDLIDAEWENYDPLLTNLQKNDFFKGRERWCELEPAHFRLMVAKNLETASHLAVEDRIDDDNPVVQSLNFLICAMIRCLEILADCHVETLKLNRVGEMEVCVEFSAALRMEVPITDEDEEDEPEPPRKDPFLVIVDNTKPNE